VSQLKVAASESARTSFTTTRTLVTFDQSDLTDVAAVVITA
jgi:hypothetical protein